MNKAFYVDTCIWLNFFQKEGDESKGIPYWKLAEDFLDKVMFSESNIIIYSDIVLKELQIILSEKEYKEARKFLENEFKFQWVKILIEDRNEARKLESKYNFEISFYDLIHIAISKRLSFILITRDKQLIDIAKENNIEVKKPEELL